MSFKSLNEIKQTCDIEKKAFWEVILNEDCKERSVSSEASISKMTNLYLSMKQADRSYTAKLKSASGLVGGDGAMLADASGKGILLSGPFLSEVMTKALKMGESNACMKKIVAAPTAGSCGVIPAVLLTYEEQHPVSPDKMLKAMYVAAGIGNVIADRAFISGAAGGCQAEIGTASAMAAGALTYLNRGNTEDIIHAAAMALKNLLGLVCDPVAGLVEVPCVKRNVVGAINAISSSDMAIAGIRSAIPPDEVIDAMRDIGDAMPKAFRETGEGGLARTATAQEIALRMVK